MNAVLKSLLSLILLAAVLVLVALVATLIFGFSFGVRIGGVLVAGEFSWMELMTVLGITVIVAFGSLVLLMKLRRV